MKKDLSEITGWVGPTNMGVLGVRFSSLTKFHFKSSKVYNLSLSVIFFKIVHPMGVLVLIFEV